MTDNMFDDFVRDKLRDHPSPVPQGLWEKIERKKDKDPRGGFLLPGSARWATLLLVIACIGLGLLVFTEPPVPANTAGKTGNTAAANGSETVANSGNASPKTQQNAISNDDNNTNNPAQAAVPVTENKNTKDQPGGNQNNNSTATAKDITAKNNNAAVNSNPVNASNDVTQKPDKGRHARRTAKNNANTNTTVSDDANGNDQGSYVWGGKKITRSNKTKNSAAPAIATTGDQSTQNNAIDGNNGNTSLLASEFNNRTSLLKGNTAYNFRFLMPGSKNQFDLSKISMLGIDCPTTGVPRRNDWYFEAYGSPDATMKSVSAKSNDRYVQKKDSTETQQGGFTAGFRVSKSIGENLLVKTGLQYSQVNERFDLRTENERRITTVITIRTIITAGGTDSTVRDTSSVEQIGYRLQRTYNRYRSIDIPLLLSYEFGSDKLKFALNAGVVLNLHSWYNGQTLNDSLNVVSLNSKSAPVYKQNIGLGLYGGFSIIKPVTNKFDIFLEPYFRYNLSNMATGSAYSQKINAGGISLGIRYKFKGQRRGEK